MTAKAASATKEAGPKGVIGNVLEGVTGQIKKYNEALEENTKIKIKQQEATIKLADAEEELRQTEFALDKHLHKSIEARKEAEKRAKELRKEIKNLNKEQDENNQKMSISTSKMEGMTKKGGILSNGFTVLAGKVAGLAAAYSSWQSVLESVDKRLRYAGKSVADAGMVTGSFWETTKRIKDEAILWNDVINKTNSEMTTMGYTVAETDAIMSKLRDGLRLTTEDQHELAQQTGEMTADIGRLSVLLRTSTDDLAAATIAASKKFGKGAKDMNAELTMMHYELTQMKLAAKDSVLNLGDLTQQVLESQASFQGYNLNLRDQARLMGQIALKAQEQGATYEMSMKAAKGLADVIAGGAAPDWAKYVAGNEMLKEVKKLNKAATGDMKGFRETLEKQFGEEMVSKMSETQIKGLKTLATNYEEYGSLSASYMAEELLRGTEMGNKEMFKLLKKYGTGKEGRELLKRVWGLDDAAATAATLAMTTAKNYEDLTGIRDKSVAEMKKRKQPSIADLEEQTKGIAQAVNMSEKGIVGAIRAYLDTDSPLVKAVIGLGGLGVSSALQLAQTGMMAKLAGSMGPGAAMAGKGALVAGAGIGGYMLGTKLREWSDALAESTGIQWLSIDKLAQAGLDNFANQLKIASFGLVDFRTSIGDAEATQSEWTRAMREGGDLAARLRDVQATAMKVQNKEIDESTEEYQKLAQFLKGYSEEDLKGMSEAIGIGFRDLMAIQQKAVSTQEFLKMGKPEETVPGKSLAAKKSSIAAEAAETKRSERKKEEEPKVVTVTKLTPEEKQAVAMQVSDKLAPEVEGMSRSMFEQLSGQGTEYYENLTMVTKTFWAETMTKMAGESWDKVTKDFTKKLDKIAGPAMMPIAFGEEGQGPAGRGPGGIGGIGTSIGQDGSITIRLMLPRDAIDASNRMAAQHTE